MAIGERDSTGLHARVGAYRIPTGHWIDGRRVAGSDTFDDRTPIDGSVLGQVAAGTAEDIDAAVRVARQAFPHWATCPAKERADILRRFAELVRSRATELAAVEVADTGHLLIGTEMWMIPAVADTIDRFAAMVEEDGEGEHASPMLDYRIRREPAGVAACIVPWNGPLAIGVAKVAPALAVGDTIVLKPAEQAPLSWSLMAELASEAGAPPGVFNVVHGLGAVAGAALVAHPDVDRISLTGSAATARAVAAAAAPNLTPVQFELGGKSPVVVLADADLGLAAEGIVAQYYHAGQICAAGSRVLVDETVADDLFDRVRTASLAAKVGDPREPTTAVGPIITPSQLEKVHGYVTRAQAEGAVIAWGGNPLPGPGQYYEPTMLTGVRSDMEVWREEVFGPVLIWETFSGENQAVEKANDSIYGLAARIYGSQTRAAAVAERVVAGVVWVNSATWEVDCAVPAGGAKQSGIGREGGRWALEFYSESKVIASSRVG